MEQLDINEKEIYSGDIVKITDGNGDEFIQKVEYKDGGYFFEVDWEFKPSFDEYLNFEIIRNYTDNPELLDKKA